MQKNNDSSEAGCELANRHTNQSLDHGAIPAILAPSPARVPGLVLTVFSIQRVDTTSTKALSDNALDQFGAW